MKKNYMPYKISFSRLKLDPDSHLPYLGAISSLLLIVNYISSNIVRVKITDSNPTSGRYEVPYQLNPQNLPESSDSSGRTARFELIQDPITKLVSFKIIRNSELSSKKN